MNERYVIAKDGSKWGVYDNDLKRFVDAWERTSKQDAREKARLLNSQQQLHDQMYGKEAQS